MTTTKQERRKIAEIQTRIDHLMTVSGDAQKRIDSGSQPSNITNWRLEALILSLQISEISSRRVVRLTWGLFWLTLVLAALTAVMLIKM